RDPLVTGVQTCALPIFPSSGGSGGHFGAPDVAHAVTEDRDGCAGAVPSVWGSGGHVGAPDVAHAVTEDRDGCAGAVPSSGGSGEIGRASCRERGWRGGG